MGPPSNHDQTLSASNFVEFSLSSPNSPFAGAVPASFSLFGSVWKVQAHFIKYLKESISFQ